MLELPTHLNTGAPGFALVLSSVIEDSFIREHAHHDSGWCTYGPHEWDGFVCVDCRKVQVMYTTGLV